MATIFEARLIGNIGKDATSNKMERGVVAINFPVAHNENWKDKKTGEQRSRTTWINCTIWKKDGSNSGILGYLKRGTLVELTGTPFARSFQDENGAIRTDIRLNVTKTNILKLVHAPSEEIENSITNTPFTMEGDDSIANFTLDEDDF